MQRTQRYHDGGASIPSSQLCSCARRFAEDVEESRPNPSQQQGSASLLVFNRIRAPTPQLSIVWRHSLNLSPQAFSMTANPLSRKGGMFSAPRSRTVACWGLIFDRVRSAARLAARTSELDDKHTLATTMSQTNEVGTGWTGAHNWAVCKMS